ncbi:hypothetical protein Mycsm_06727 (plasmid) [Mycobacterium sp. JS623]|uniref:hypothetical protein n=1 Tax=Mycobacterium sp. JS623 TaxID=212767 RepID=UPI0002A5B3AC|nr:hypothetical protein [Mycobacterium sp. JS623]AGB26843.1 hypothetical protein Mycsm_06727 [Mycobacterium sp. JS623]
MFTRTIHHPQTSALTTHPGREVALAALEQFLRTTGQHHRISTAIWTHADYEILDGDGGIVGSAAIDEICVCSHAARDHDEIGCTAITFAAGPLAECPCQGHRPVIAEADLFAPEVPT